MKIRVMNVGALHVLEKLLSEVEIILMRSLGKALQLNLEFRKFSHCSEYG